MPALEREPNTESEDHGERHHQGSDEDRAAPGAYRTAQCDGRRGVLLALLVVADVEHPHGPWDVLQVLSTEILEDQVGASAHLLTDHGGHTDPTRVGQCLHAGCNIQTVAIRPRAVVHHVPEVDTDPKAHLARRWH